MIDHAAIANDLLERKLNQLEIAKKHDCSPSTVVRVAREIGFTIGRGVSNHWVFKEVSVELAYLIGVYLTDGSAHKAGFSHTSTSLEYATATEQCLDKCGIARSRTGIRRPHNSQHKIQYSVQSHCSMFSKWLKSVCAGKSQIPTVLWDAPIEHKVAFVCGAIDGDGHVTVDGGILIRGKDNWLRQLPEFLHQMGVRSNGVHVNEILPSGLEYLRVPIRRDDFRKLNPQLAIPEKQDRLMNAKNTRPERRPKRYKYPCPICGELKMSSPTRKYCRDCYMNSDEFHQHLINVAPLGSEAGNKARWGKKD